jgi:hypothetical protein
MVKKKVVAPTLYVHQAAPVIHRNISTTADGRCLRNDTNIVNLPLPVHVSLPSHFVLLQEPTQNAPYVFDDAHIPINPKNRLNQCESQHHTLEQTVSELGMYFGILHSNVKWRISIAEP